MYLFVDETECPEYFIVTGLLVNSMQDVELAYKRFKKKVDTIKISPKKKAILFTEFKSTLMDKHYQKAKAEMLCGLNEFEYYVVFSCFEKKNIRFVQEEKESTYLLLISRIVSSLSKKVDVVFDRFNKKDFEMHIIGTLISFNKVSSALATDSQTEIGLKYVDNLCSVVRLKKTNQDVHDFYTLIEKRTKEV